MKNLSILTLFVTIFTFGFAQKEKLEFNLTKGQVYNQNMDCNLSIAQKVKDQSIDIDMKIKGNITYKVTDIKNNFNIDVQYNSLSMTMNMPNGPVEFSSSKKGEDDIMSNVFKALTKKPFVIIMSKEGKVVEVKNIDKAFDEILDSFSQLSRQQKKQIKDQLAQSFGEKSFKNNLEMSSAIFPANPVEKGEKWIINSKLESGMSADIETTYELAEVNETSYVITGVSVIKSISNKDYQMSSNGMEMKYDLKGDMTSRIKIHKNSGWTIESTIEQNIEGTTFIKPSEQIPDGMEIPMKMTNEMKLSEN
jgi:hypothetical protein